MTDSYESYLWAAADLIRLVSEDFGIAGFAISLIVFVAMVGFGLHSRAIRG